MKGQKIISYLLIIVAVLLAVDIFTRLRQKKDLEHARLAISGAKIDEAMPRPPKKLDDTALLIESDKLAEHTITRMFYQNFGHRLEEEGLVFNPYKDPDYLDLMKQLYERYTNAGKVAIYKIFGYDAGIPIVYICEHYEEWQKMKQVR